MDFFKNDLIDLHNGLVNGDFSAVELTQHAYSQIKANSELNAFTALEETTALERAAQVDQNKKFDQVLTGIPVAVKDNIVSKTAPTTAASKMLKDFTSVYDATVVERLKDVQAIEVGKTNLDEFAMGASSEMSFFGPIQNAWDHTKVPGGSSGGSAVAVASGEVPVALGSDTGGSIRQPASFNGIVGVKPTYGRVSRWGLIAFGSSLDQIGPMTRRVKDNALVLNAIAGHDERDTASADVAVPDFTAKIGQSIKGMHIGVPKEFFGEGIDPEVEQTTRAAVKQLEGLGAIIDEVSLPHARYGVATYYIIGSSEASSNLQRFDGVRYGFRADDAKTLEEMYVKTRSEGFGPEVKRRIMLGTFALSAGFYDAYFKKAAQVRTKIIEDFDHVFDQFDVIVGPTAPTPAFNLGQENNDPKTMYMNDLLTIPVNIAGLPGLSVNAGFSKADLPIGLQVIAKPFEEQTMYQVAEAFEQATRLFEQTPEVK